jgi:hypothetical protein
MSSNVLSDRLIINLVDFWSTCEVNVITKVYVIDMSSFSVDVYSNVLLDRLFINVVDFWSTCEVNVITKAYIIDMSSFYVDVYSNVLSDRPFINLVAFWSTCEVNVIPKVCIIDMSGFSVDVYSNVLSDRLIINLVDRSRLKSETVKGRDYLRDLGLYGRIILKCILKKYCVTVWIGCNAATVSVINLKVS